MDVKKIIRLANGSEDNSIRRAARMLLEKHKQAVPQAVFLTPADVRNSPGILRRAIEVLLTYHGDRLSLIRAMSAWRRARGWEVLGSATQDLVRWVKGESKPNYKNAEMLAAMYNETL